MITGENLDLDTQTKVLNIQTQKNLLVPELITNHYKSFIQLSDKNRVQDYMQKFIKSISYVGHTDGINMEQVTQVVRGIFKSPDQMDSEFLLDFLITLAVDNANFQNYNEKSKKFIETCLDYVEEEFAGIQKFKVTPDGQNEISIFRLKPIVSNPSVYNKTLALNPAVEADEPTFMGEEVAEVELGLN